jgi:two-component system LytT family response regulator
MKLRAYLADDEPLAIERLRRLLERFDSVEIIGSTSEPETAVRELTNNLPDICFLDIEMPRLTGFDVIERLPKQPIIVFTTAYDHYALKAFGVNSIDYLLKPIEPEDLERALNKVQRLYGSEEPRHQDLRTLLQQLTDSIREASVKYPDRIASRLGDKLWFLDLADVTHFRAEDKLTYAVSEGKQYSVDYSIMELEKKLDPEKFVRVHRGTVVNVTWIKEASTLPGGALNLRLKDRQGTDLTVARDRAREFKTRLGY